MSERVVIVGGGQAGAQTAMSLRQGGFEGEVLIVGSEAHLPYQRPPLSKQVLQGEWAAERCLLRKPEFYSQQKITIKSGVTAKGVDTDAAKLLTAGGGDIAYDWLVICTGSELHRLVLPGTNESGEMAGIHYLRSLDEAANLQPVLQPGKRLVVIGGGYIGLEVAASARKLGCEVSVVEALDGLMKRSAFPEIARYLQNRHSREGVTVYLGTTVTGFSGSERLEGVVLGDGTVLPADAAVVGVGVKPAIDWLADSGIECNRGVLVNDRCQTNIPKVLAAGDVTEHEHQRYSGKQILESVQNAIGQGRLVAAQINGTDTRYAEVPWFWSEQYDCRLQMAGLPGPGDEIVSRGDPDSGSFSLLAINDGRLTGVQAINAPKDFMAGKQLIAKNESHETTLLRNPETDLKELL